MRRFMQVCLLLVAGACLDEKLTLGEACSGDDECLGSQICGRTQQELELGLPGVCVEKGGACDFGEQLGCTCDSNGTAVRDDDFCVSAPPRYQTNMQVFVKCDLDPNSPTYDQCILDDGMMGGTG